MCSSANEHALTCRIKHVDYRITDIDRTIEFYQKVFGMKLLRRLDIEELRISLLFVGYGDIETNVVLEFYYSWDAKELEHGNAFQHICIGSNDIHRTFALAVQCGAVAISKPYKPTYADVEIAWILDPDGYKIELMQD
ncbi:MAG: lactoylglutathione lyase [Neisseriaceae bacterium]|nr:MAG: lactoylglutathione lyase [Neisseriaceae bacterium]